MTKDFNYWRIFIISDNYSYYSYCHNKQKKTDSNKGNTLLSGQFLNPGDFLQSLNGKYKVVFGGPKGRIILANGNYATGATTQFIGLNLDAIGVKLSMETSGCE